MYSSCGKGTSHFLFQKFITRQAKTLILLYYFSVPDSHAFCLINNYPPFKQSSNGCIYIPLVNTVEENGDRRFTPSGLFTLVYLNEIDPLKILFSAFGSNSGSELFNKIFSTAAESKSNITSLVPS